MRRPPHYPAPRYKDPNDRRLIEMIGKDTRPRPNGVNILGVPFDGGVLGRRGAAGGPKAIRESLSFFSNYSLELGMGLARTKVTDLGDVVPGSDDVVRFHQALEPEVAQSLVQGSLLVLLGGDNSISLPALRATANRLGEIGLVTVDSHLDLRGEIEGKPTSGSSYGLAIESVPGLDAERVSEIGIHGFLNSADYAEKARKLGVDVVTADSLRKKGVTRVAEESFATAQKGADAVYLSVDLDAVDISAVSGVSAPSVGGIAAGDLMELVRILARKEKTACADVVELAPSLDPTGRSQIVAATCVVNLIAGFAGRAR
ncbi:MAG: agmatinase family protein [Thaumarchaeota archaeon]|nr:agmatinase family protein [Nitrososphaerota archaeon]